MTLAAKLKALRAANVFKAEFFEGTDDLKSAEFFAPFANTATNHPEPATERRPLVTATGAAPDPEIPGQPFDDKPKDLIRDVLLTELPPVELTASDYPKEQVEELDSDADAAPETE
jgi:hypothetical protein